MNIQKVNDNEIDWLSISIISDPANWQNIIRSILSPFIFELNHGFPKANYFIQFVSENTPKIILSVKVKSLLNIEAPEKDLLKNKWEAYTNVAISAPAVKYNFSQFLFTESLTDPDIFYFATELTDLILEISKNTDVTEDELFLIALYVQLGLIKSTLILEGIPISSVLLHGYCGIAARNPEAVQTKSVMNALFEENKTELMVLYKSVILEANDTDLPYWFKDWHLKIHTKIAKGKIHYVSEPILNEANRYLCPSLVNIQMGLPKSGTLFQNYFIHQMAQECDN